MAVVADSTQNRRPRTTKPFLGGWRNTVTGLIYHNACTQTHNTTRSNGVAQTVAVADAITEVVHDQAVQVHFLPDARDRVVTPGVSHFGAEGVESSVSRGIDETLLGSVVKIQRCYR